MIIISKKKKKKGKKWNPNPWAVCHTTVDKDKNPEKYERCVMDVKGKQASNVFNLKMYRQAREWNPDNMQRAKSIIHQMIHSGEAITLANAEKAMADNGLDSKYGLDGIQFWEYVGLLKKPDASQPSWVVSK